MENLKDIDEQLMIQLNQTLQFQEPGKMEEVLSEIYEKGLIKDEEDYWFHVASYIAQINKTHHGKRLAFAMAGEEGNLQGAAIKRETIELEDVKEYLQVYDRILKETSEIQGLKTLAVGIIVHPNWVRSYLMIDECSLLNTFIVRQLDLRSFLDLPYEIISRSIKALEILKINI